jgi:iron(III) transport system ATP-binding protein
MTPRTDGGRSPETIEAIGVKVDGVSKRYTHRVKGEVYAAREVSLDVRQGEFLTLLGPSGCGKTTTLRMIAGFEQPDAGHIVFGEQEVTHTPANERGIGFVFQNYALFPHLSVLENVAYGLRVRGHSDADVGRAVGEVLAQVGLAGYEQQFPAQLSGGEQQRVALARAIVIRPRVLLFDEPLSNLDARLRVQMRAEIRALQRRLAITTVYVTHDQEEAMAVSDRIAVMNQGRIVQEGSAEDLYYRPASLFVARFIGRVNLIPGRVHAGTDAAAAAARVRAAAEPSEPVVAALGQAFRVPALPSGVGDGDSVRLLVRPEAIDVTRAGSSVADGSLVATVAARTFLGEKIEYVLQCQDESLQVVRHSASAEDLFDEGQRVGLRFVDRAITVLKEGNE